MCLLCYSENSFKYVHSRLIKMIASPTAVAIEIPVNAVNALMASCIGPPNIMLYDILKTENKFTRTRQKYKSLGGAAGGWVGSSLI
jgi:hypothetical protein